MPVILETPDFIVTGPEKPHHSRENGGHIVVWPNKQYAHFHEMPPSLTTDFTYLLQIVGEAFMNVMQANGLRAVRINYANFGNWAYKQPDPDPKVHVSLYLRTWGEKHPDNDPRFMAFPEALYLPDRSTGYYDHFSGLTNEECRQIKDEIVRLLGTDKYRGLSLHID